MAHKTANLTLRIDPKLKAEAETLFTAMGLTMAAALNIFLLQAVRQNKIPFEISNEPNKITVAAIEESEK
ncbi:MAG: type II toxin-antitoxin system RelB/DinJ family antitoxin, partial [Anaerovoracaceae bacterium]